MKEKLDITASKYAVFAILKSLNPSYNKELIRLSKNMAKKTDDLKENLLNTAGKLKAIEEDKIFNLPPYLLIDNSKEQLIYWVIKITKFYEYILNKIDEVNSGKPLDIGDIEEYVPDKKKVLADSGLMPKLRLIRKQIPFKDIANDYGKVIVLIEELLNGFNNLYKYVEIFNDIMESFLTSSLSKNTIEDLEEFSNAQVLNLFTQYKFKLNATNFLTYSTKKMTESFKLFEGIIKEYNNQIKKGGGL